MGSRLRAVVLSRIRVGGRLFPLTPMLLVRLLVVAFVEDMIFFSYYFYYIFFVVFFILI